MKKATWFSSIFLAAFGITFGAISSAAVGDYIYETPQVSQQISGPQAACFADCAIDAGLWDGNRADMTQTGVSREDDGFVAWVRGVKTMSPAEVAASVAAGNTVPVVGVVE